MMMILMSSFWVMSNNPYYIQFSYCVGLNVFLGSLILCPPYYIIIIMYSVISKAFLYSVILGLYYSIKYPDYFNYPDYVIFSNSIKCPYQDKATSIHTVFSKNINEINYNISN